MNFNDTPRRIDFSSEVSMALQSVENQIVASTNLAMAQGCAIMPLSEQDQSTKREIAQPRHIWVVSGELKTGDEVLLLFASNLGFDELVRRLDWLHYHKGRRSAKAILPTVFSGIHAIDTSDHERSKSSLTSLQLNDASLVD